MIGPKGVVWPEVAQREARIQTRRTVSKASGRTGQASVSPPLFPATSACVVANQAPLWTLADETYRTEGLLRPE